MFKVLPLAFFAWSANFSLCYTSIQSINYRCISRLNKQSKLSCEIFLFHHESVCFLVGFAWQKQVVCKRIRIHREFPSKSMGRYVLYRYVNNNIIDVAFMIKILALQFIGIYHLILQTLNFLLSSIQKSFLNYICGR